MVGTLSGRRSVAREGIRKSQLALVLWMACTILAPYLTADCIYYEVKNVDSRNFTIRSKVYIENQELRVIRRRIGWFIGTYDVTGRHVG